MAQHVQEHHLSCLYRNVGGERQEGWIAYSNASISRVDSPKAEEPLVKLGHMLLLQTLLFSCILDRQVCKACLALFAALQAQLEICQAGGSNFAFAAANIGSARGHAELPHALCSGCKSGHLPVSGSLEDIVACSLGTENAAAGQSVLAPQQRNSLLLHVKISVPSDQMLKQCRARLCWPGSPKQWCKLRPSPFPAHYQHCRTTCVCIVD